MFQREKEFNRFLEALIQDLIELIPNAETGSILVREGLKFYYKAAIGFNLEELQKVIFNLESISIYERKPHILTNLDDWNQEYLNNYGQ